MKVTVVVGGGSGFGSAGGSGCLTFDDFILALAGPVGSSAVGSVGSIGSPVKAGSVGSGSVGSGGEGTSDAGGGMSNSGAGLAVVVDGAGPAGVGVIVRGHQLIVKMAAMLPATMRGPIMVHGRNPPFAGCLTSSVGPWA